MKINNMFFKLILQIIIFISIVNIVHAKNFDKYKQADKISNYFSGIVALNDSEYFNSYKYLKKLEGLEDIHLRYSQLYQYALVNIERFEEAFKYSKKLEKKGVSYYESNLVIGIYHLKNENYNLAKKYFKKLRYKNSRNNLPTLLTETLNLWVTFPEVSKSIALKSINELPKRYDSIKKIQNIFTHCFYNSEDTIQEFEKLNSEQKESFQRYNFFFANYLNKIGKKNKAILFIDNSIDLYPKNLMINQFREDILSAKKNSFADSFDCQKIQNVIAEIFYITANALSSQSQYALSNFYINLAKYLNPNFTSFETLYAENFFRTGNYNKAQKIYEKIKNKGSVYSWYASKQKAATLFEVREKVDAVSYLEEEFKNIKNPKINEIYEYASFLKNNKKYKEAALFYTKVLENIDSEHFLYAEASDGRGIAYERTGRWEKAELDFLNSLKASPDQAYVMNYLAYSWIEKGINIEKSLKMLEKANELKKNDGYIIDSLGWALFKLKRYKESKDYLQEALSLMPFDPTINDHFADSLWMNSQKVQARYYWNTVLKLDKVEKKLKNSILDKLIFGLQKRSQ